MSAVCRHAIVCVPRWVRGGLRKPHHSTSGMPPKPVSPAGGQPTHNPPLRSMHPGTTRFAWADSQLGSFPGCILSPFKCIVCTQFRHFLRKKINNRLRRRSIFIV